MFGFGQPGFWAGDASTFGVLQCLRHGSKRDQLCAPKFGIATVSLSGDGLRTCTASGDKISQVFEADTGKCVWKIEQDDWILCAALTNTGDKLATSCYDGLVYLWDTSLDDEQEPLKFDHQRICNSVQFSKDDKLLLTSGFDKRTRIFETAKPPPIENADLLAFNVTKKVGPDPIKVITHTDAVMCSRFSPDETMIATASGAVRSWGEATTWDTEACGKITSFHCEDTVTCANFSPDMKTLVASCRDRTTRIFDLGSGQELRKWVHPNFVTHACFSADGKFVATSCDDANARVFEVSSRREVQCFRHPDQVSMLMFTQDDKQLATACRDGAARMWGLVPQE